VNLDVCWYDCRYKRHDVVKDNMKNGLNNLLEAWHGC
jgi:hypothetical protein